MRKTEAILVILLVTPSRNTAGQDGTQQTTHPT